MEDDIWFRRAKIYKDDSWHKTNEVSKVPKAERFLAFGETRRKPFGSKKRKVGWKDRLEPGHSGTYNLQEEIFLRFLGL